MKEALMVTGMIDISSYNLTSASGPSILFRTARGTEATPANLAATQRLGSFNFTGYVTAHFPT